MSKYKLVGPRRVADHFSRGNCRFQEKRTWKATVVANCRRYCSGELVILLLYF